MKKVGLLVFILLISLILVSAQNANETESITKVIEDKAYACLENKLGKDCASSGSTEQIAFSLLAMASKSGIQSDCKSALLKKQKTDKSWENIKDTSLAIIALDYIGKSTKDEEKWLLNKKRNPTELEWYLEIEITTGKFSQCTLTYDSTSKTVNVNEDKKISGSPGNCLSLAYDNYWLKINPDCLNRNFTVSCNEDFLSTLIYKKTGSNVWHISSDAQASSASGTTEHEVKSYCFGSTSCNYEENLWAALALQNKGYDLNGILPYLTALSEDNKKLFPESFLYIFKNSEDYLQEITSLQKTSGYWDLETKGKYYDTALAILSLSESESENLAKEWLSEVQGKDGCWNNDNIRDTAFILWAAYPKTAVSEGGEELPNCELTYYCTTNTECIDAAGNKLDNYWCASPKICCDKPALQKTCTEMFGKKCPSGQECDEATVSASDTTECCLGECTSETSECESFLYQCRLECSENEETALYTCGTGEVCCKTKEAKSYWWIYLLVILIILVVLGILLRNKLRILIFKFRSGFKKGPVTKTRPGFPPAPPAGLRRMFPTRMLPVRRPFAVPGKAASKIDKELEETLKKLKEIGK